MYNSDIQEIILNGTYLINDAYNNSYRPTTLQYTLNDKMGAILLGGKEFNTSIDIPIRGTEITDIKDIITDLEGIPIDYELFPRLATSLTLESPYKVHKGGYDRYRLIADDLFYKALMQTIINITTDTVNLYGHSMGCWPALFLFLDHKFYDILYASGVTKLNVILYAPPTTGNKAFAELVENTLQVYNSDKNIQIKIFAVSSNHDLVPDGPTNFLQAYPLTKIPFDIHEFDELGNHQIANFKPALIKYFASL